MYGTGTVLCPVASFIKYLGKLNPNYDVMWQKPRDSYDVNDSCWYGKQTLGTNLLAVMMTQISESANKLRKITKGDMYYRVELIRFRSQADRHCIRSQELAVSRPMSVIRQQHKSVVCPHHYHHLQQTVQNSATSITNEAEIAANYNTELNDSDTELNYSDTEFNDSDTELVDHYDSLIQSIQRGDAELQPLPL